MLGKKWRINEQGWFTDARHCHSNFYNQRPEGEPVSLLVIHGISLPPGQFGGPYIDQLFTGAFRITSYNVCYTKLLRNGLRQVENDMFQFCFSCFNFREIQYVINDSQ